MVNSSETYPQLVRKALFSFQMIEEALKIYIGLSYEIINNVVPQPLTFKFEPNSINDAPLGKLIKWFSSISINNQLINELRRIEKWRNFCAHQAYLYEFKRRQSGTPIDDKEIDDLKIVAQSAIDLVTQISSDLIVLRKVHAKFGESKSQSS